MLALARVLCAHEQQSSGVNINSRDVGQRMLSSGKMIVFISILKCLEIVRAERELVAVSVATDKTDGYKRFERSCQI